MFDSEDKIKMALFQMDLDEKGQTTEMWARICETALKEGTAHGAFEGFEQSYLRFIKSGDQPALGLALRIDMRDNYIIGAFAAKNVGIPVDAPLIAWNAKNRSEFVGWHGEIATVRTLLWAGYNPSIQDEAGATALHYMVNLGYGSGCNPRAVRYLLEAGCDVSLAHNGGDTALITLCGHVEWTSQHTECFKLLVSGDADPFAVSSDGATPLSLLMHGEELSPNKERQWLLVAIGRSLKQAGIEEGTSGQTSKRAKMML